MKTTRLLIIVGVLLMATMAYGTTYYVKQDGTGDFEAIQEAIDAAATGDTIVVAPGTYPGGISFGGKAITLTSAEGPEVTIVDGDRNRAFLFDSGETETSVLSGFTITNYYAHDDGGGILCRRSSPTIRDNVITGNSTGGITAEVLGGGIYCDNANPHIINNIISGNSTSGSKWGYGYGGGLCLINSSPLLLNNLIVGNVAGTDQSPYSPAYNRGVGGAIYCRDSAPTIMFCTFHGNSTNGADNLGGLEFVDSSSATIANCIITGTHHNFGEASFSYCCFEGEARPGSGNISADPLFASGRLGEYYLSAIAAGQDVDSPCIDAGMGAPSDYGLMEYTTRTDGIPDTDVVDMGYHYPGMSPLGPRVLCSLNAQAFAPGDLMQCSIEIENPGAETTVDVFVGFILTDGSVLCIVEDGLRAGLWPRSENMALPSGLSLGPEVVLELTVPCVEPGFYTYGAALALSGGTGLDFVSVDSTQFEIVEMTPLGDYYIDAELGDDSNDGSQDRPWKTVTHALDSVEGSETSPVTFHVAAGVYSVSTNGETFPLNMKSWVSLVGEGANNTVLYAQSRADHVVSCEGIQGALIEGMNITGGMTQPGRSHVSRGGGIYCRGSSIVIRRNRINCNSATEGGGIACDLHGVVEAEDNIIKNNTAQNGGAIFCGHGSPVFSGNIVRDNWADSGGGIYCSGGSPSIIGNAIDGNSAEWGGGVCCASSSTLTIQGCTIEGNVAEYGGGICSLDSEPTFLLNTVSDNSAGSLGGGICCIIGDTPDFLIRAYSRGLAVGSHINAADIRENVIERNGADYGGGIYCSGGAPLIADNNVRTNEANHYGAGMQFHGSYPTIRGNRISANHCWVGAPGSGVGFWGYSSGQAASPVLYENIIDENTSGGSAAISCERDVNLIAWGNTIVCTSSYFSGGIYSADRSVTIFDSIIWTIGDDLCNCSATYCCIEDDDEGEGDIHDDPLFVAGPLGDYYLDPASPCIDAGSRSAEEAGLSDRTTQADGTPDIGTVDMGFHYPIQ